MQAYDPFCSSQNTVDNVCTITKDVRLSSNLYYTTTKSIVLIDSKIKCLDTSYKPCTIHFFFAGDEGQNDFEMRGKSTLQGKQVIIQAPRSQVIIGEDS